MKRGFIQIPILIAIFIGAVAVGGTGYVAYETVSSSQESPTEVEALVAVLNEEGTDVTEENLQETKGNQQEESEIEADTHIETSPPSVPAPQIFPTIVPKTETPSVDNPFQVEDSNLKIARCQAKRDADYSTFVSKTDQMIADAVQKIKDEARTFIDKQLQSYDACLVERPEVLKQYDSTMSPYDLCSFYLRNAEAKKTYTDQLVAKTRASRETFLPQGKTVVDNEYYQCVNR